MATNDFSLQDLKDLASKIQSSKKLDKETEEKLGSMAHSNVFLLRSLIDSNNTKAQNLVGPFEHQAFAREYVKDNPVVGSIGLAIATPLYSLYKAIKPSAGRSQAGLQEVSAGYKGIGQGLMQAMGSTKTGSMKT